MDQHVPLAQLVDAVGGPADLPGTTYASMLTPAGLAEVATYADPDAVLAASRGRSVEMFLPVLVEEDGGWTLSTPPGLEHLLAARGAP